MTHVGHIMLPPSDDATCRVLDFHNDTGAISEGRAVRCIDTAAVVVDPVATDANGRASSIRGFFTRR